MYLTPAFIFTARRPRDVVIIADSSSDVSWPAMVYFIKQVVGGVGASPQGTHYSIIAFANGAVGIVTFPVDRQSISQYNVPSVRRFIDAGAPRRPTGSRHHVDTALVLARTLLTDKRMGARRNARKVTFVSFMKGALWEDRWF